MKNIYLKFTQIALVTLTLILVSTFSFSQNIEIELWEDMNGDGFNNDAVALSGWAVELWEDTNTDGTPDVDSGIAPTNSGGLYTFTGMPLGTYAVKVTLNANYYFTQPGGDSDITDLVNGYTNTFAYNGSTVAGLGAGMYQPVTIGDMVWEDLNGNGIKDGGEPGLNGIDIEIETSAGGSVTDVNGNLVGVQTSAGGGIYSFDDIPPGEYVLTFTGTANTHFLTEEDYSGGNTDASDVSDDSDAVSSGSPHNVGMSHIIIIASNEVESNVDAGYFLPATVSDFVWEDLNGDGIQDGGELGIDGVDVDLYDNATGAIALDAYGVGLSTTTAGGGLYEFEFVKPGNYYVKFGDETGNGYYRTEMDADGAGIDGTNNSDANQMTGDTDDFDVFSDDLIEYVDAGYYQKGSIGDFCWEDIDGNGAQDGGEPGLGGVVVSITDDAGAGVNDVFGNAVGSVNSAGDGSYIFDNLPPGNYIVTFTAPALYYLTTEDYNGGNTEANDDDDDSDAVSVGIPNTIGESHVIELESDETEEDIDAGFFRTGKIGDFVWCDGNGNGIQDDGAGAPGVTVTLVDGNMMQVTEDAEGNPINSIITGNDGMYMFQNLPPGDYKIRVDLPDATWGFTLPNYSGDTDDSSMTGDDSDVDAIAGTGFTHTITIESGDPDIDYVDIGAYTFLELGGIAWLEEDGGNSMYDGPPENGIFGIDVQLWSDKDCDGVADVLTDVVTIMDPLIGYSFTELPPGCWIVKIPGTEFAPGNPLNGVVIVDGYVDASVIADNDNNGFLDTDGGSTTSSFEMMSDCMGGIGQKTTVDFGFKFDCSVPNDLAAESCEEAEIICNLTILDGFCGQMSSNQTGNGPSPLCDGFGVPHNISWFAFVAGDGDWTFYLEPFACSGDGVQLGIFDGCDWETNIFCDSDCQDTNPISVPSTSFEPGQTYWMFLDGCSGSVCSYSVDILGNFIEPSLEPDDLCILEQGGTPCEDITICPGKDLTFEVLGLPENIEFTWEYTTISGATFSPDGDQTEENFVTLNFPEVGVYEICMVFAFNGCQGSTTPVCRTVTVEEYPDETFMDQYVCTKDYPYAGPDMEDPNMDGEIGWQGPAIAVLNPDGEEVTAEATSSNGCVYDQTVTVFELQNIRGDVIISSCGDTMILGIPITMNFSNIPFDIPDAAVNGCDSLINLTATILQLQANIEPGLCFDGEVPLSATGLVTQPSLGTPDLNLSYLWTNDMGEEVGTSDILQVTEDGNYCLTIFMEYLGANCEFAVGCMDVIVSDFLPIQPSPDNWQLAICEGQGSVTLNIADQDDSYIYNWTVTGGTIVSGQGDESVVIDWQENFLTPEVCVFSTNVCGDGIDTCVSFNITPTPSSMFVATDSTCVDSIFVVQYMGNAAVGATYNWDFAGGTIENGGNGIGPGPHELSFSTPGFVDIGLSVVEAGCQSDTSTITGQIVTPLQVPMIDCGSNSTTITFSWPDVAGAAGYQVDVIEGNTGMMMGTNSYEVGGLQAGDSVTIQLTVLTDGPCGIVTVETECFAQDCSPQVLTFTTPQDSFCLDPNLGTINLSASVASGDPGVFTFSGPGITDPALGTFDPNVAGVGTHMVRVDFQLPDGCKFNKPLTIRVFAIPNNDIAFTQDTICINSNVNVSYTGGSTGVMHDWIFNDAIVNSGNAGGPYNLSWNTIGTKNVSLIVERNNCESVSVEKSVEVEPLLLAPVLNCTNTLNSVGFTWGAVVNATGYNITVLVNGVPSFSGFITDLNYDELGLNPNDEVSITVEAVSGNSCPNVPASRTCFANDCNPISLTFAEDVVSICADNSTTPIVLDYTVTGGNGMGNGIPTWSGTGVSNGTFDPNVAGEGTFTVYLLYEEAACNETDSLVFEITQTPTTDFTVDQMICISNTATVNTLSTTGSTTAYTWPTEANVTDIGNGEYELTFTQPGTYTIDALASKGACDGNSVSNTIIVEPELDPIVFNTCVAEVDMVSFSWNAIDCATDYEVLINGVSQGTQTGTTFDVDMLSEGDQVNIEVIAISDCLCGNVSASDMCTAQNCPPVMISLDPQANDICLYNTVQPFSIDLTLTNDNGMGVGVWSGTGVDANGVFDPNIVGPGNFLITYTYDEGTCNYGESVMINVFDVPTIDVDYENPDCYTETETNVTVVSSGGDANYSYIFDGVSISDVSNLMADEGSHTIEIIDGNECTSQTSFNVSIPSQPVANITGNPTLQTTQEGNYSINPSALTGLSVSQIIWYVDGVEVCNSPDCYAISQMFSAGDHVVSVEIFFNDGCMISDEYDVSVDKVFVSVVTIPNIISPNNDGTNNLWSIHSNETIIINSVQIFDRWGTLLYDFSGPVIQEPGQTLVSWDGKYENKYLQPGVYVYAVNYATADLEEVIRGGDITIIR